MLIYKKFIDQRGEPFSKKILHKMQLNAERCRRYREKCKRLKLRVSIDQDTRDLDTNASRGTSTSRNLVFYIIIIYIRFFY